MNASAVSEFYLTIHVVGAGPFHAGRPEKVEGKAYPTKYHTACGLELDPAPVYERIAHVTCPECLAKLYGPGISHLVQVITEINTANGWRENKGFILTEETPEAQVAGVSSVTGPAAAVVEAIRKPGPGLNGGTNLSEALEGAKNWADLVHHLGAEDHARWYLNFITREAGQPLHGSKTQAIAKARLIDTETEELTQAILADDVQNIEEEVSDVVIRALDFEGDWNEAHPDKPISIQRGILAKLEKNRSRGHKHGGKTC